jgi:hypothetical protein
VIRRLSPPLICIQGLNTKGWCTRVVSTRLALKVLPAVWQTLRVDGNILPYATLNSAIHRQHTSMSQDLNCTHTFNGKCLLRCCGWGTVAHSTDSVHYTAHDVLTQRLCT